MGLSQINISDNYGLRTMMIITEIMYNLKINVAKISLYSKFNRQKIVIKIDIDILLVSEPNIMYENM